jgi:hypothetical protein
MKYKNNLSDHFQNTYFEVISSFDVLVPVGTYPSNTYFGSTQALGVLYRKITLSPGDYLLDLAGGVFVSYNSKMYPARLSLSDKHPFEKVYIGNHEEYPVSKLKEISKLEHDLDVAKLDQVPVPKKFFGRGVDSLEE